MEDKVIKCVKCGEEFTFTVGEQEFFAELGFDKDPKRCKKCRDEAKAQKAAAAQAVQDKKG